MIGGKGRIQAVFGVGEVEFQVPVNSWMPAKQCPLAPKNFSLRWRKLDPIIDFISDVLSSSDYPFGVCSPEYVTVKVTEIVPPSLVKQTGR